MLSSRFSPKEAVLAHPVADRREDQLRLEESFMQSPFIVVSGSCSIRHTKRENQFDVYIFFDF